MNVDDNDKLWELLGRTKPTTVSPFFARNVLRAIRQEEDARPLTFWEAQRKNVIKSLKPLRRWSLQIAIAGTCALAALVTVAPVAFEHHHHHASVHRGIAKQIVGNPDYEVINHLDELVADEESSLWLDDSSVH